MNLCITYICCDERVSEVIRVRRFATELVSRSLATSQRRRNLSGCAAAQRFALVNGWPLRLLVVVSVARERSTRSVGSSFGRPLERVSARSLAHNSAKYKAFSALAGLKILIFIDL